MQERPPNSLIKLVHKHLGKKMENCWLPMYYNSDYRAKALYNQRTKMADVVDDVLFIKNTSAKLRQYSVKMTFLGSSILITF